MEVLYIGVVQTFPATSLPANHNGVSHTQPSEDPMAT